MIVNIHIHQESPMQWILYGATGITGRLITEAALRRGDSPILAGRNADRVRQLAEQHGLPWRAVDLTDDKALRRLVGSAPLTLLAASPFDTASLRVAYACIDTGTHYLDLANEIPVLEAMYGLQDLASERNVTLLPGVGFGTVAADTLACHVVERLPTADVLDLTIDLYTAGSSPGARGSTLRALASGAQVRRRGQLTRVGFGSRTAGAVVPPGARTVVTVPSGELAAVYRTTGVPNISVSRPLALPHIIARAALPALAVVANSRALQAWVAQRRSTDLPPSNPATKSRIWAHGADPNGQTALAQLETGEGYAFSAESAVAAVEAVLADPVPGAYSPGALLGPDFALRIAGTRRVDAQVRAAG
jgi:short subunit dehydrogenase-like uncharacterized protein